MPPFAAYFQMKAYADARESLEKYVEEYPNGRYVEKAGKILTLIHEQWEERVAQGETAEAPAVWLPQNLFPRPQLHQSGTPAPGILPGQPEGSHLRQPAQDGMHRPA